MVNVFNKYRNTHISYSLPSAGLQKLDQLFIFWATHPPTQEEVKKWQLVEVKASCTTSTSTNAKLSMNTN